MVDGMAPVAKDQKAVAEEPPLVAHDDERGKVRKLVGKVLHALNPYSGEMDDGNIGRCNVKRRERPLMGYGPVVGIVAPGDPLAAAQYIRSIESAGGIPLRIPYIADKQRLLAAFHACDCLVFAGCQDLDTTLYGEKTDPNCGVACPDVARDQTEVQLMRWAVQRKMPFLAVCRGLQVLNVAQGGSLWQDLNKQRVTRKDHRMQMFRGHRATVKPGTQLSRVVKASSFKVNSLHHQAVKEVGEGLTVSALAPDGIVEGLEVNSHPFGVAVQFHPEMLAARRQWAYDLFTNLIDVAKQQGDKVRSAEPQVDAKAPYLWVPAVEKQSAQHL